MSAACEVYELPPNTLGPGRFLLPPAALADAVNSRARDWGMLTLQSRCVRSSNSKGLGTTAPAVWALR